MPRYDLADSVVDIAFLALVLWAIVSDFRTFRIPNAVSVGMVALFMIATIIVQPLSNWPSHVISLLIVFIVSAALFYLNVMGGGDVKFLAATALWVSISALPFYLLSVSIFGGVLTLVLLAIRMVTGSCSGRRIPLALRPKQPVPYGVAIGLGALTVRYFTEISIFHLNY